MNLFVLLKMVPDTVEELEIAQDERSLDQDLLRFKLCDADEHALEQAVLMKEKEGGTVTAVAFNSPEVDDVLFTALAKGADRAVKLTGDWTALQSQAAARMLHSFLTTHQSSLPPDTLIMTRSQAIDELEGGIGPYLADLLGIPYLGIVTSVVVNGDGVVVTREFAGGLRGEFTAPMPVVLGIQSAQSPPRYIPFAKVRNMMKTAQIETVEMAPPEDVAQLEILRMYKPETSGRAEMIEGEPEAVAEKLVEIMAQQNLI